MSVKGLIYIADCRSMEEIKDKSIQLIVTSPPYWHIKNYKSERQIGYGQTLHEYLKDLYRVWSECYRVLEDGRRLVINIGDQFARSVIYGRYKIIPIHSEIINQCEKIGFDYMGSIIWQKKTTMNTTGGANVMGSYPYPPNGMIEVDYEYILIFKKPGKAKKVPIEIKEKSKLSKEEWKEYFKGHWNFPPAKQIGHEAMFPEELPRRIIKMFSFVGETVLDPFMGSGTTAKVCIELGRNVVGYEINEDFEKVIREKVKNDNVQIIKLNKEINLSEVNYEPLIQDAKPYIEPEKFNFKENLYKVIEILPDGKIKLDTGLIVKFKGIRINQMDKLLNYLKQNVLRKEVFLKFDSNSTVNSNFVEAYVYLKNKIFINSYLIKVDIASVEENENYDMKTNFLKIKKEIATGKL